MPRSKYLLWLVLMYFETAGVVVSILITRVYIWIVGLNPRMNRIIYENNWHHLYTGLIVLLLLTVIERIIARPIHYDKYIKVFCLGLILDEMYLPFYYSGLSPFGRYNSLAALGFILIGVISVYLINLHGKKVFKTKMA